MANINDSGIAHVHRFRDRIALSVGDGSTFYLTGLQAIELATFLSTAADDVNRCEFAHSSFGSHAIPIGVKDA